MNMLYRTLVAAPLVAAVLAACQPDDSEPASVCPLTGPVRLAAPPDGWAFDPEAAPQVSIIADERIAYTYDANDPTYRWQLDVCGGEPEKVFVDDRPYFERLQSLDTPAGEVTYYFDELAQMVVLERDDLSESRPVAGLPAGRYEAVFWREQQVLFERQQTPGYGGYAAGIGGSTRALYSHDGDPERPAVFLADEVAVYRRLAGPDLLALHDDGELLRVDVGTGERTTLVTGARAFHVAAPYLIWQELGDDVAEPVYLRDLETGSERLLRVNDFCQRSWNRDPEFPGVNAGGWIFAEEVGFAGFIGPGLSLLAVHRLADGAAIEVPAHDQLEGLADGVVHLRTLEPGDTLSLVIWDPLTDALHRWYHGPLAARPGFLAYDGEGLDYLVYDDPELSLGSMWRYELASGQHREVLPRMRPYFFTLEDGRYVVQFPRSDEPFGGPVDLVVVDRDTGSYTTVAEQVHSPWPMRIDGLIAYTWLDVLGPEPGLWVTLLPPK